MMTGTSQIQVDDRLTVTSDHFMQQLLEYLYAQVLDFQRTYVSVVIYSEQTLTDLEKRMYGVSGFFGGSKGLVFVASRHDDEDAVVDGSTGHLEWYEEHCDICRGTSELHGAGREPAAEAATPDWCSNGDWRDDDGTEYAVDATLRMQSSSPVSAHTAFNTAAASAQLECVSGVEYCMAAVEDAEVCDKLSLEVNP